jgi:transposase
MEKAGLDPNGGGISPHVSNSEGCYGLFTLKRSGRTWNYDRELYKRRNKVKRLFRHVKRCSRVCARYDKLDAMFTAFIYVVITVITLRRVNTSEAPVVLVGSCPFF